MTKNGIDLQSLIEKYVLQLIFFININIDKMKIWKCSSKLTIKLKLSSQTLTLTKRIGTTRRSVLSFSSSLLINSKLRWLFLIHVDDFWFSQHAKHAIHVSVFSYCIIELWMSSCDRNLIKICPVWSYFSLCMFVLAAVCIFCWSGLPFVQMFYQSCLIMLQMPP